jgi:multidrug transporter EmrE-like cation transporter
VTLVAFFWLMLSESCTIAGQVFFKRAMAEGREGDRGGRSARIAAGMAAMTAGFFLWLSLLKQYELSYLYPFEGCDRIILVVACTLFLKERLTRELTAGMLLIVAGTVLVSLS